MTPPKIQRYVVYIRVGDIDLQKFYRKTEIGQRCNQAHYQTQGRGGEPQAWLYLVYDRMRVCHQFSLMLDYGI